MTRISDEYRRIADIIIGPATANSATSTTSPPISPRSRVIQPICINSDNTDWPARIACEKLGWTETKVTVVDLQSITAGEFAENEFRKGFTPSERCCDPRDPQRPIAREAREAKISAR
jgi:hypothetical protein